MAVYYKWIKGCSEGSTLNGGLWSYIKWADGVDEDLDLDAKNNLPHLYTCYGKKDDEYSNNDLGYFLTSRAENVQVEGNWHFVEGLSLEGCLSFNESVYLQGGDKLFISGQTEFDNSVTFQDYVIFNENVNIKDDFELSIGTHNLSGYKLGVAGAIKSNDSVHAPYFNATSDMRAKENIKKLPFSALSFINNLSVYQFNYKGKNDTVPGVLAQDVLNSQPEGLSLVDNIDASGENGDYMSIKEDKFIFLLMRAVQELKEDNDALRYEIEQLKQKLK